MVATRSTLLAAVTSSMLVVWRVFFMRFNMLPNKKTNTSTSDATLPPLSTFEDTVDSRFKAQMKESYEVVLKYTKSTHQELKPIRKSQDL